MSEQFTNAELLTICTALEHFAKEKNREVMANMKTADEFMKAGDMDRMALHHEKALNCSRYVGMIEKVAQRAEELRDD